MAFDIKMIDFRAKMPEIPAAIDAVEVTAPALDERRRGIGRLAERLRLGKVREAEAETSRLWTSRVGDVEFFPASGAVWCRNLAAAQAHENELRKWPDLVEGRDAAGNDILTLGPRSAKGAGAMAREIAKEAGFDLGAVAGEQLDLIQVAQLSEKGEILSRGAGEATLSFAHALDGVEVFGPGAKTSFDLDPDPEGRDGLRLMGAFHVWRRPVLGVKVEIGGAEAALAAGLLQDPDLTIAVKKGARITVEEVRFGLMALPALMRQGYLFPALAVAGRVELAEDKLDHYRFGRYCHAATPKAYAAAGLAADYLARPN